MRGLDGMDVREEEEGDTLAVATVVGSVRVG